MTSAFPGVDGSGALSAIVVALVFELVVGEFPTSVHPVAWFGKAISPFDRAWKHPVAVGVLVAVVLPAIAALAVGGVIAVVESRSSVVGAYLAGVVLFTATSLRMLLGEARAVAAATADDLDGARERLLSLAGRDASTLSAGEVRSAAVESAAENLADGLVAPLLAFVVGSVISLPVAAGAAVWVKAVNTLDSMLGYHSKPVGTASARLDDAVMWIPARVSAMLLAVSAGRPRAVRRAAAHADAPPSPNSGWPMATLAAVLDVRLEKPGSYELPLGDSVPNVDEGLQGVRHVGVAGVLAYVLAGAGVVAWS